MFGHLPELIIVLILALIFFGPEKLPEIAGSAGKMVGELRAAMDAAMHQDTEIEDDEFSTYYYDSMERSGEEDIGLEDLPDPADDVEYATAGEGDFGPYEEDDPYGAEHDVDIRWDSESGAHPVAPHQSPDGEAAEVAEGDRR